MQLNLIYLGVKWYYRNHDKVELFTTITSELGESYAESLIAGLVGFSGKTRWEKTVNMFRMGINQRKLTYLFFNLPFIFPDEYVIWKLAE